MARGKAAARQAAVAISMKKEHRRPAPKRKAKNKKDKGRFPGDVNKDGKIDKKDFILARAKNKMT